MTDHKRKLRAADLFCGAGGTSQGLLMAANEIGADLTLVAVNHWQVAIDTHAANHPYAKHLCTGLDNVDPRKLVPGGRLDVLCASPECTHHSVARGGKPMSDQSRASAWHVLRFCEALYVENVVIENVTEFQSWGPLGANGRPLKSKKGQLFQQLIASFRALGYKHVEWRELVCADYGDPTTRKRLFIVCRRNKPIRWPEPTHVPAAQIAEHGLFADDRKPWRTAREIIDWSIPSQSIFERKRPLADKTLARIEAGLRKFCGIDVDLRKCMAEDLRPFLVVLRGTGTTASVDEPLHTVTASGNHYGLVQPFLAQWDQTGSDNKGRSIDEPVPTVVTKANTGVVEPVIIPARKAWRSDLGRVGDPVIDPFLVQAGGPEGKGREPHSIDAPMATVVAENHTGLVQSFILGQQSGSAPREVDAPLPTVATGGAISLTQSFLIAYYGTQNMSETGDPLPTVTTHERFGLVEAEVMHYRLDIRFRMLQPRELARAQGFPDSYKFTGNREDVVKQIGNAVPPHTAKALIMEALA